MKAVSHLTHPCTCIRRLNSTLSVLPQEDEVMFKVSIRGRMKVFQQLETFSTVEFITTDGLCSCFHELFKVQRAANAQCCKTHLHVHTGRTNLCPSSHYMYTSRKATHSLDTCGAFHDNVRPALDLRVASRFGLQLPSSSLDLPRTRSLAR